MASERQQKRSRFFIVVQLKLNKNTVVTSTISIHCIKAKNCSTLGCLSHDSSVGIRTAAAGMAKEIACKQNESEFCFVSGPCRPPWSQALERLNMIEYSFWMQSYRHKKKLEWPTCVSYDQDIFKAQMQNSILVYITLV